MTPRQERNLIFGSFVAVGVLVAGIVGYRALPSPAPRTMALVSLHDGDDRAALSATLSQTIRIDDMGDAKMPTAAIETNTEMITPATPSVSTTPAGAVGPEPERETVAMLSPAPLPRVVQSKSPRQKATRTAQLDVCAKIRKKRVYYTNAKGRYWRCA